MKRLTSAPTAGSGQLTMVIGLLVGLILIMGILFSYAAVKARQEKEYVNLAGEQRLLSQRMVKYATEASGAQVDAFPKLKSAHDRFGEILAQLQDGSGGADDELAQVAQRWQPFSANAEAILKAEGTIRMLSEFVRAVLELMPQVLTASDNVANRLVSGGASMRQVHAASRQLMLGQRMAYNVNKVLQGGQGADEAAAAFVADTQEFGKVLAAMLNGGAGIGRVGDPQARQKLEEIAVMFRTVSELSGRISERTPELAKARAAAATLFTESDNLLQDTTALVETYAGLGEGLVRRLVTALGYVVALAALVLLVRLGLGLLREARQRLEITTRQNEQNQAAVTRLMDEIGNLASGDLTVTATVTHDFTAPIAERVNYAIEALRRLVTTLNDTAVQVSSAAAETQATAIHLAEAADHQAQQITSSVAASNEMAASIEQVSANATESSEVAQRSVAIAKKGATTVQDTIRGMDTIREQIQETSKRIKRLGESSQEIGEIVELINALADQTNILALNAAIQAAMAGEAGSGFAIVADEVQRLAERSADATRQIEALVKTIQADTGEAVSSMERSTTEVVNGTRLARAAGEALVEIDNVSAHLANLIEGISDAARQQALAANNISETMNVIQDLTVQTAAGTNETAASISNLTDLANELRESVSGFKLPH